MPKAWSEREKELIKDLLRREGRKLFEQYGLQKTTVDELAHAARISKGAFYHFYRSKEELYFDILELTELEFREKLYDDVFAPGEPRKESFKRFCRRFFDLMTTVPIYRQLSSTDYEYLMRKLPPGVVEKHMNRDLNDTSRYFGRWMEQGFIREMDLEILGGLLLSMVFFIIHRDDFGRNNFDAVKEVWVEMLSLYLVKEE